MTVLILGSGGLVGGACAQLPGAVGYPRQALDIRNVASVASTLDRHKPSAVLNCAALAKVDQCDTEPERAWSVNAEGPARLAELCQQRGVRLVHLSTDYVLTGAPDAGVLLREDDPVAPKSTYARSKRGGELAVIGLGGVVVRVQWVYSLMGKSFFSRALRALDAGQQIKLVTDQVGIPTPVSWLAPRLYAVAEAGPAGLFHLAPRGEVSAYGWIEAAATHLGISMDSAVPISRSDLGGAFRPARSCLDASRFHVNWPGQWPTWKDAMLASLQA